MSKQRKRSGLKPIQHSPNNSPASEVLFRRAELFEEKGKYREAFDCLLEAARLGHSPSQLQLGNFYSWGRGVKKDLRASAYWYRRIYRGGNSNGALNLAIDLKRQKRLRAAVQWLKKAVSMNNGDAFLELASIYSERERGKKVAESLLKRALKLSRDNLSELGRETAKMRLEQLVAPTH